MAKVNGGWLTAKTLYDFGIRNIFSLGGGHINPIYDACVDLGIRIIDTHHEQGAAMAADAYGRSKRRPAVCLVTAGPGLTNALTGIAGSYLSNSPLIIISGRSGIEENDRNPLQEIDQQAIVTPITKWARTIYDQKRIPEYIGKAYKTAITGKPGPVYLGMSYEVLYPRLDDKDIDKINFEIPKYTNEPSRVTISEVLNHLKKSRKPIAIVGSGGWYSDCEKELKRFIESANIPTFTLNLGRGIISDEHKNCFGAASPSAPNGFREISSNADLILLLGIRLSLYMGFGRSFNKDANIVQVEIDPNEVGSNISPDLAIICDLKRFLIKLNRSLNKNTKLTKYISWNKTAHQLASKEWKKIESVRSSNKKPIHAVRVAKCVEEVLGNDGIVVIDGGDCQAWTDVTYRVKKPGGYMKGGLLGCMGVGVPFAIGTKLANPK
ncbi:MAG: thiamine pyrophosphate-binding protein, partial [Thermodesulfobacteriota bacterium]